MKAHTTSSTSITYSNQPYNIEQHNNNLLPWFRQAQALSQPNLQVDLVTRSTHVLKKTDKVQTGSTKLLPWFGQARVPQSNLHALNKT